MRQASDCGRGWVAVESREPGLWLRTLTLGAWLSLIGGILALGAVPPPGQWHEEDGARWRPLSWESSDAEVGFRRLDSEAIGIDFANRVPEEVTLTNQIYLNGSGVAAGDVDGDGWVDLYLCRLDGPNALFRNRGGWRFEKEQELGRAACAPYASTGANLADMDGDGDPDLLVTTIGKGVLLFSNDGAGRFGEASQEAGLGGSVGSMSMAVADVNGDGHLDLYVANYRASTLRDMPETEFHMEMMDGQPTITQVNGRPVTEPDLKGRFRLTEEGEVLEQGRKDRLFLNNGGGSFTDVPFTKGFFLDPSGERLETPPYDWGLSAMFQDINGDRRPDLYVCNDFSSPDRIWLNTGHGFRAIGPLAVRQTSRFSMGIDFSDINRDGYKDFFVADMLSRHNPRRQSQFVQVEPEPTGVGEIRNRPQYVRNSLYLGRRDGTYAQIASFSGVEASEWSWSAVFLDVDLDGYEDLLITNGHARDAQNADVASRIDRQRRTRELSAEEQQALVKEFPKLEAENLAFRNQGDRTFEEKSRAWGFHEKGISHGMALADFDRDGDQDLVINHFNGEVGIYENLATAPRIAVRLRGEEPNTQGIGAEIRVLGGPVPQQKEVISGGRYLSDDGPLEVFATGSPTNRVDIRVTWRDGSSSAVTNALANRVYEISQGGADVHSGAKPESPLRPDGSETERPWFEDRSGELTFRHHEDGYDDFGSQPLLPRRLSRSGPGVAWYDWDGDGWVDLLAGTGRGGRPALFLNDREGGFRRSEDPAFPKAEQDQTTLLAYRGRHEAPTLMTGMMGFNDPGITRPLLRIDTGRGGSPKSLFSGYNANAGPLAMTDLTGEGRMALFVGGQPQPGRYPGADPSFLFREAEEGWRLDLSTTERLQALERVNGAAFSDINQDGWPDLVLACDWGPIRLFANRKGELHEVTEQWGLTSHLGWWNGVATGDFNEDGRPDLVASNWGRNTRYERDRSRPLRLHYGEVGPGPGLELIESHYDERMKKWVPDRRLDVVSAAIPGLGRNLGGFVEYGQKSLGEIFGDRLEKMQMLEADTLESMLFLNRGDRFEARPLPGSVQLAPTFGIVVGDYNGDGHEDLFLGQNFFSWPTSTPRSDAGRGVLLIGDGQGGFKGVPGSVSGVRIYGEQKGAAKADFDQDGRLDLVVGQNGRPLRLFRNREASPGLRVRLKGPPGNPDGLGAQVRLVDEGGNLGPVQEVQAGSGYWSQNSRVLLFGLSQSPKEVRVRWSGGQTSTRPVPEKAEQITISY